MNIKELTWASDTRKNRRGLKINHTTAETKRFYLYKEEFNNRKLKDILISGIGQETRAGTISYLGNGVYEVNLFRAMKPGKIYQYILYWNWGDEDENKKIDVWLDKVQS